MADGEWRLGHADGQVILALCRESGQLLARLVREGDAPATIAALHQGGELGGKAHLIGVEQPDLTGLLAGRHHGVSQIRRTRENGP